MIFVISISGEKAQRTRGCLACAGATKAEYVLGRAYHELLLRCEFKLDLWYAFYQTQKLLGS